MKNNFYTIAEIKKAAQQYSFKLAGLEDNNGNRLVTLNKPNSPILGQLNKIEQYLKRDITPDGIYSVVMAETLAKSKNPERFYLTKGKVNPEQLNEAPSTPVRSPKVITVKGEDVLSYQAALDYQREISDLKNEIALLKMERDKLKEDLAAAEEELEEKEALSETAKPNSTVEYLKETIPSLFPIAERFFDWQEKKVALEEKKLFNGKVQQQPTQQNTEQPKKRVVKVGSEQHLEYIRKLFNANEDEKMDRELDKLEKVNPELYNTICNELGLIDDGEEEEEEGGTE